jgi:DNA-binding CsgD family transcriptional regulator
MNLLNLEVDYIYASLLGEQLWSDFTRQIILDIPAGKAVLQMFDSQDKKNTFIAEQSGFDESSLRAYNKDYSNLNILQKSLLAKQDGIPFSDNLLVPQRTRRNSIFFNEWLLPNGINSSVGMKINSSGSSAVSLVLLSEKDDNEQRMLMSKKLSVLAPHMQRVSNFYKNNTSSFFIENKYLNVLDSFSVGYLLINNNLEIIFMNNTVSNLLDEGSTSLKFNRSRLKIQDSQLSTIISEMTKNNYRGPKSIDYYLPKLKLCLLRPAQDNMHKLFNGASLLILINGVPHRSPSFDRGLIAKTYKLTAAEMRAAEGLVLGKSATKIAHEAGLSLDTIRTQVRSLYRKTGAHSQADIIRLVRPR